MKKIITIIGARPQFIKAAALSRCLKERYNEIIIHTGQHFDENMSDIFFRELEIPAPKYNLGIAGGSHGAMTGAMLAGIEKILLEEKPDAVLLYGDTNSTLAGALAAVKIHIPVFHVEAGNRLGTLDNPEEVNRITTDHLATLNFCATDSALEFLKKENLGSKSSVVGNVMYDAFLYFSRNSIVALNEIRGYDGQIISIPEKYCYMTCHRAENTSDDATLLEIFKAVNALGYPTIYPVHPRNRERAIRLHKEYNFSNIMLIPPVGYLASIALTKHADKIVTDSGGLQCEAFYAGVQCVTVFEHVVWPETLVDNRNQMCKADAKEITDKLSVPQKIDPAYQPFGDGHACEKIVESIDFYFKSQSV